MLSPMAADPDSRARTHLANERTFLAWFRTGIGLIALGLAAAQFLDPTGHGLVRLLSTLVIGTGAVLVLVGGVRYDRGRKAIDATSFQPASRSIVVAAALAVTAALVAIGFVWLLRTPA
jgi:putative membrane protein